MAKDIVQKKDGAGIAPSDLSPKPMKVLSLGTGDALDVSNLSDSQIGALEIEHAKNMLDLQRQAGEAKVALGEAKGKLDVFSDTASKASRDNLSVTITNVHEDRLGRTEVVIGNTDSAKSGRISMFQRGGHFPTVVVIVLAAIVLAAIFVLGGK